MSDATAVQSPIPLSAAPSGPADLGPMFEPFRLGRLSMRNRFAMAPMTRQHAPGGVPSDAVIEYYRRRAAGGIGLVITEGVAPPHPLAPRASNIPHLHGENALAKWRAVVDAVHAEGAAIMPQLLHSGLGRAPEESAEPDVPSIGPSETTPNWGRTGLEMTERDIEDVVIAHGEAAATAERMGFDGVNVHGAHGYLIDQFFWGKANRRTDRFGGADLAARTRFAVEIIREIRRRVSPDFPIMFRFSQWKSGTTQHYRERPYETPQDLAAFLEPLTDAGVDIFDASIRRFWLPEFEGSDMNLSGWAKKLTGRAVMTIGSVSLESPQMNRNTGATGVVRLSTDGFARLREMYDRGDFDLVAVGRILLANPAWPNIVRDGNFGALRPYDPIMLKMLECADHPAAEGHA